MSSPRVWDGRKRFAWRATSLVFLDACWGCVLIEPRRLAKTYCSVDAASKRRGTGQAISEGQSNFPVCLARIKRDWFGGTESIQTSSMTRFLRARKQIIQFNWKNITRINHIQYTTDKWSLSILLQKSVHLHSTIHWPFRCNPSICWPQPFFVSILPVCWQFTNISLNHDYHGEIIILTAISYLQHSWFLVL